MDRDTQVGELCGASRLESDVAADSTVFVRGLAFNVRHCRGAFSPFISEQRTAAAVLDARPDVAGLTEVYRWTRRDQPQLLADLTGFDPLFFGVRRVRGGEYGLLLLSRFPLREVARIPLPGRTEPRGCLLAEIESAGGIVTVGVTHLGLGRRSRRAQLVTLLSHLPRNGPLILMGDFNSRLHDLQPLLDTLAMPSRPPATFPSLRPMLPLDLVLFSRDFTPLAVQAPRSLASDHRPVVVDLVMSTGRSL